MEDAEKSLSMQLQQLFREALVAFAEARSKSHLALAQGCYASGIPYGGNQGFTIRSSDPSHPFTIEYSGPEQLIRVFPGLKKSGEEHGCCRVAFWVGDFTHH